MRTFAAIVCLLLTPALNAAVDLETVLRNMDATAAEFRGMQANVEWVKYTAFVDVKDTQSGDIYARRNKDGSVDMKIDFQKPSEYFFLIRGTKAQIYRPRIATVEEYDVSKSKDLMDQVMLLVFGTAGTFLEKNYHVTLKGEEMAAGEETVKLELVPKSEELLKKIPRLELWVSKTKWHPVQDKAYEQNSKDYHLHTYSNIVLNPPMKDDQFRLKLPGGVKKVTPQK